MEANEPVGHVYRVLQRDQTGIVFQRCTAQPMTFQVFKRPPQHRRLRLDASPRREGHTFVFDSSRESNLFGFFLPEGADRPAVLKQVKARWGLASEIDEKLWDRTKSTTARG